MRALREQRNSRAVEQQMRASRADSSSAALLFCCFADSRRHAGFTLTETLISIAIVVVVAAIAWPTLLGYAREQTLRESAYRITRELDAQRNDAERRGVAIAAFIDVPARGEASIIMRRLDPMDLGAVFDARDGGDEASGERIGGDGSGESGGSGADERGPSGAGGGDGAGERRLFALPARLTVRQPGELARDREPLEQRRGGGGMMLMADPEVGMGQTEPVDRRWLVAVYLPDGTVVAGTGLELTLGRLGPVRIVVEAGLGRARATEPARDPMLEGIGNPMDAAGGMP